MLRAHLSGGVGGKGGHRRYSPIKNIPVNFFDRLFEARLILFSYVREKYHARHLPPATHGSRLTAHGSRLTAHGSWLMALAAGRGVESKGGSRFLALGVLGVSGGDSGFLAGLGPSWCHAQEWRHLTGTSLRRTVQSLHRTGTSLRRMVQSLYLTGTSPRRTVQSLYLTGTSPRRTVQS